jgi:hypothetical protein
MRRVTFGLATMVLVCEAAIALPIDPVLMAPIASGRERRVARRTLRRGKGHIRRMYICRHY